MKYFTGVVLILTLIISGCEKDPDPYNPDNEDPTTENGAKIGAKLDLTDADFLVLKDPSTKKTSTSDFQLYKMKSEGNSYKEEKVKLLDQLGNEIDSLFHDFHVRKMIQLKSGLLCLSGHFEMYMDSTDTDPRKLTSILVSTSDGAIFDFNDHYPSDKSYYLNQDQIQTDRWGNVYYHDLNVFRLREWNEGYLQEEYLPSGEEYFSFFIDRSGNCYYYEFPYTKAKKSGGGIAISDMYDEFYCIWNTYNDIVMAARYDSVGLLSIEESKLVFRPLDQLTCPEAWTHIYSNPDGQYTMIFTPDINDSYKMAGSIVMESSREAYDLQLPDPLFTGSQLEIVNVSGGILYLQTPFSISLDLVMVDLGDYSESGENSYILESYTQLEFPDNLQVESYEFNDDGTITFTALRLTDEMYVIGTINTDNIIVILRESDTKQYNNLIRLN